MKTIAFAASNSSTSINHQLIQYAAQSIDNSEVIKLTDYPVKMYNEDTEDTEYIEGVEKGIPKSIIYLDAKLAEAGQLVISINEHNGNISAFFKNILDWLSRYNRNFLANKKILLLSTSPGANGAKLALSITEKTLPIFGAEITDTLSIGSFYAVFRNGKIVDQELNNKFLRILKN